MKVICIGDNNVDCYKREKMIYPGGNCVNVAVYMKQCGWQAAYMGVVGDDQNGKLQKESLEQAGVDASKIRVCDGVTSSVTVELVNHDRIFSEYDAQIHQDHPLAFCEEELRDINQFDLIHTSCYSIFADGALEQLYKTHVPIAYDFSEEYTEEQIDHTAKYIRYAFFSAGERTREQVIKMLEKACDAGCFLAVCTMGSKGAVAYDGKGLYEQPSYPVEVVDTMGAGDSFIAQFLACYMEQIRDLRLIRPDEDDMLTDSRYLSTVISFSLSKAAFFAASHCMKPGAFGNPYKIL
ncbi:MAG: PfkB family carbohydrate kinase [bacterium]|nr:PfkB family carbohydrate kinase [bacterium]